MKKFKKIIITSFLSLFIIAIYSIAVAEAQDVILKPNVDLPGYSGEISFEEGTTVNIARYVKAIYDYGISIGAILATVVLMAAGVIWLTSSGSQEKIGQAKNMISGSIIGLILLLGSYTILNTVNPELVDFYIDDIGNIAELELGCCQYTSWLVPPTFSMHEGGFTGGHGQVASEFMLSYDCERLPYGGGEMFGPEYIPRPETISGGCVKSGCCSVSILQVGSWVVYSGTLRLQFPSTQNNCPDVRLGVIGLSDLRLRYSEDYCEPHNALNCKNLSDGTQCFSRGDGTWQGWLISSNCKHDGQCGYCYNGSCLPLLGKPGEICGVEGNIGKCVSGNSCPAASEKITGGRNCYNSTCCSFGSEIIN